MSGSSPILGVICGLESEAIALGPWRTDPRVLVRLSAGQADRAAVEVERLHAAGVAGLLSWGLCGGLDPALAPGDLIVCDPADILCPAAAITAVDDKATAFAGGKRIVDLESGPVTRTGLPARAIRIVLDEAGFSLPAPATVPLRENGTPNNLEIMGAVLRQPWTIPAMIALARRYGRAMRALRQASSQIGALVSALDEDGRF